MTEHTPGNLVSIEAPRATADLRGRPLLDLRISVMDRCNFRCPYCMPRETFGEGYRFLPAAERLSFEEILALARAFAAEGVRKIRLTGGEPLLRTGLADLVGELSAIDGIDDLALTTNGVLLAQHAAELAAQGLSRVTVSLDSIDPATFRHMNGGFDGLDRVLDGIRAAREAGLAPVKVNAVVQRGVNDGQVLDLARYFRGSDVVVRFIEYMDVGNRNDWRPGIVVPIARDPRRDRRGMAARAAGADPARRGRRTLRLCGRRRRDRIHFVRHAAILRRLHARAAVLGRRLLHLPVRDGRDRLPFVAARGRGRRRVAPADPRRMAAARGSLQRVARAPGGRCAAAQDRDVLHWRMRQKGSRTSLRTARPPWWT